jgi:iron(III) transport system permease protein
MAEIAQPRTPAQGVASPLVGTGTVRLVLGVLTALVVGLLCLAPVVYIVVNSFNAGGQGDPFILSLEPYQRMFSSARTMDSLLNSFILSIRAPIAVAIAFVIAWLLVRVQIPGHRFIEYSLWFSFFLPILPITVGWTLLLSPSYGLINEATIRFLGFPIFNLYSMPGIIWVHLTASTIPIMTILLAPALRAMDASLEEASDMAGAGTRSTLRRITFPLIAPAALTALLAGFVKSLEVFEVEQLLGVPAGIFVYSTRIYNLIRSVPAEYPQAMALSTVILVILVGIAVLYARALRAREGIATITGRGVRVRPRIRTKGAYVASAVIIGGLVIGVFLPFAVLLLSSFTKLFGFFFIRDPWTTQHWIAVLGSDAFLTALRNSLFVGFVAATLGSLLYLGIAWVIVRLRVRGREVISLLTWLPWAIPGLLLSFAFLSIILSVPGVSALHGTIVPLVIVLIVAMMPLGVHLIQTSLMQLSPELEEAAAMSGASLWTTLRRITLPLVGPMMASVFILVFMTTMRDVAATVLVATPGTRTLPLLMFEYATAGRSEAAAVIGVLTSFLALGITAIALRLGLRLGA